MSTIASWAHAPSPRATWALGQALVVLGVIAAFVLVPVVSSSSQGGGMAVTGLGVLAAVAGVGLQSHVRRRYHGPGPQRRRMAIDDALEGVPTNEAPSGFVALGLLVIGILAIYYCAR